MSHPFSLWAPGAERVEVLLGADPEQATRVPMSAGAGGWWQTEADPEPHEGRYAFSVDGGMAVPDPRSRRQPDGVHAPSQLVETSAFEWSARADGDEDPWRGVPMERAAIYELHIGTFTDAGTFDAAIEHLDHLVALGITVVEVMPVAAFPGQHGWGYDGVAPYAVHEPYGGPEGFARFIDAAHGKGLAVWLDVVYNHLGPSGNYLGQVGPYFTDRHHTPWGEAVNLDGPDSDGVRAYLLDNVEMWLIDYRLDGLRLDAVHELHDERATHLLEEFAALADEISERTGIPRCLVAESDRNDPATVAGRGGGWSGAGVGSGLGGLGLQGQWADDVHHALHTLLTGESQGYYADFADADAAQKVLGTSPFLHDGTYSTFRGRVHGRPVDLEVTPPWRYVASLQTHDQVGNRATGDRIHHGVSAGRHAIGAALLLTAAWTPMLFMGEEWGASTPWQYFTDHQEEWLAESIRQGRQAEFASHGWGGQVPDPQDPATVEVSTLDWTEVGSEAPATMLAFYRDLLHWRRETSAVHRGEVGDVLRGSDGSGGVVLAVTRPGVALMARLSGQGTDGRGAPGGLALPLPEGRVLTSFGDVEIDHPGRHTAGTCRLGPDSVLVLVADDDVAASLETAEREAAAALDAELR